MSDYHGMRWFKCDLHIHTPEDHDSWRDAETKLLEPRRPNSGGTFNDQDIRIKAQRFLHRCHDLGLQVVGITNHNFSCKENSRDWFLTYLVEENKRVARERGLAPLFLFPGFEVDIGYHLLCLFDPVSQAGGLETINRILIKLGLPEKERIQSGRPTPLRRNGEKVSLKELIEIVQGEHSGLVIAAHGDEKDGLLSDSDNKEDYSHPDLSCVELTKNPPPEKYASILKGKNSDWKRNRVHPAWIQSSDAKSLAVNNDGQPVANSLG